MSAWVVRSPALDRGLARLAMLDGSFLNATEVVIAMRRDGDRVDGAARAGVAASSLRMCRRTIESSQLAADGNWLRSFRAARLPANPYISAKLFSNSSDKGES